VYLFLNAWFYKPQLTKPSCEGIGCLGAAIGVGLIESFEEGMREGFLQVSLVSLIVQVPFLLLFVLNQNAFLKNKYFLILSLLVLIVPYLLIIAVFSLRVFLPGWGN
jgi:hypothetical protein